MSMFFVVTQAIETLAAEPIALDAMRDRLKRVVFRCGILFVIYSVSRSLDLLTLFVIMNILLTLDTNRISKLKKVR